MVAEDTTEAERRLQDIDLLRRRVLNVIPHALRTPITTFRGLAEALQEAPEHEIRTTIAPALQRVAAQAEHLLDDMLIAAGLTTTLPTATIVAAPVAETARRVWQDVASGRAALQVAGSHDERVLAPDGSLFRILVHVLDNAAKYGSDDPTVTITRNGDHVVIAVESPGEQMREVEMFDEPFFRGERAVMGSSGLGVGLAVARALAEHAGGSLSVAARDGGGVTTTFELRSA